MQQAVSNRSHCAHSRHPPAGVACPLLQVQHTTGCLPRTTAHTTGLLARRSPQQQEQQQEQELLVQPPRLSTHQQRPHGSCTPNRRQLLLGAGSLAPLLAATQLQPAQAAAGASCQLQQSATGMQWCDLQVGEGQLPIQGAFTKANYQASLASTGTVFDSTYQRKQPLVFKVGECEVVKAFDVAILGGEDIPIMREGGKRLVVVPPGPMQRQGVKSLTWVAGLLDAIDEAGEPWSPEGGFNSTLVFEIELVPKRRG